MFIPKAYAQGFATQAAKSTQESTEAGLQQLINVVRENFDNWIAGLIVIVITWIISKIVASAVKRQIIRNRENVQESLLILIERITKTFILSIGIIIAAALNGFNLTAVLGALSLGIGFALKDIIGNYISGIIMLSQNRIQIGDLIKTKDILGTIVSIDTRATILQAIDGTEVVIPNQSMLNETIISYSTNPFRRIELIVGVDYKTDLPTVTSLIRGIIEKDADIVPKPDPMVLVNEFGDSSINIRILFWVESSKNWLEIRSNLANKIRRAFTELNINIPFPIRTLKVDQDDPSLLKTIDSLKKGFVPESEETPSIEETKKAAMKGSEESKIPQLIFKDKQEKTPQEKLAEQKSALEKTQNINSAEPRLINPSLNANPEKPSSPPTHL